MKVLIVDDEAPARERIAQLVGDIGGYQVVGGARNGDEALHQVQRHRPDVVLMDVRMPGMDGLCAAARLRDVDDAPAVIFVSAFGEHALEAFDVDAADYLVKPVRRARLEEALARAGRLSGVAPAGGPEHGRDHVLCRRRGDMTLIPLERIHYFQADHKYVTVRHDEGEDLIEESLRQLEETFPGRLVRIHRNALVCRRSLGGMERDLNGRHYVAIRGIDQRLEVSRRHVPAVRRLLRELGQA